MRLYEDMRIELLAVHEGSIPCLDVLDPENESLEKPTIGRYRRYYFLRRSIGTLYEFSEGLRLLTECPEFDEVRGRFDTETARQWDTAAEFFRVKGRLIQNVRHDIGGHFGSKAAIYAVRNLSPAAIGKIEIRYDSQNIPRDARLHFASDIAVAALLKHLPGDTIQEQMDGFINGVLVEGYGHATNCVKVLIPLYFWPRFGR
jgi:hypothetical protein